MESSKIEEQELSEEEEEDNENKEYSEKIDEKKYKTSNDEFSNTSK